MNQNKLIDDKLMCLKQDHNEPISMIVMDDFVEVNDRMLCEKCISDNLPKYSNIVTLDQARVVIQKQLYSISDDRQAKFVNFIQEFSEEIKNLHSKINQAFESIQDYCTQWLSDIVNVKTKSDLKTLVSDLRRINQVTREKQTGEQFYLKNYSYIKKINEKFKDFLNLNQHQRCFSLLKEVTQSNKMIPTTYGEGVFYYCQQVSSEKQHEACWAMAFNCSGTILVAPSKEIVKIWEIRNQQMIEQTRIRGGHTLDILCVVFSKRENWFATGSLDKSVICWKLQPQGWDKTKPETQHRDAVSCLIFNNREDQLISGSFDRTIKVWKVNYLTNLLEYDYALENRHTDNVRSISMNESETALFSCSDDKLIILWTKGDNKKWRYAHHIEMHDYGYRISFISDFEIAWVAQKRGKIYTFEYFNETFFQRPEFNVELKSNDDGQFLFPTIYHKALQLIIIKHNQFVHIFQRQTDGRRKSRNWIASGSGDCTIRLWKDMGNNQWISSEPGKVHKYAIYCLLMNGMEDQLISGSGDSSIKIWNINYEKNQLNYEYSLDKHSNTVFSINLNESDTTLVSCSYDKQILIWRKGKNHKWEFKDTINKSVDGYGYRICFINDQTIAWQQNNQGYTHIFKLVNDKFIENPELKIELKQVGDDGTCLFPTVFNKQKQILIQRHNKYVYIIRQQQDGQFKIECDPIDCISGRNYGALTKDGSYLIIWNYDTKEFKVYRLIYE